MAEAHWESLRGQDVRYEDRTWELTGDVAVLESGELLAVEARQTDDVRGETATLHFELEDPPDALNPGDLGEHFHRLTRTRRRQHLVVEAPGRTYRYELRRLEYE
jgi:hypothetical protein